MSSPDPKRARRDFAREGRIAANRKPAPIQAGGPVQITVTIITRGSVARVMIFYRISTTNKERVGYNSENFPALVAIPLSERIPAFGFTRLPSLVSKKTLSSCAIAGKIS
jgi:hypothetical protein